MTDEQQKDDSVIKKELSIIRKELSDIRELIQTQSKNEDQISKFTDKKLICLNMILACFGASISIGLFALQTQSMFMEGLNIGLIVLMVVLYALMLYYNWQISKQFKQSKSTKDY
jgi:hypothetical protein